MPSKSTVEKAKRDLAEGKKPTTAAGEFVRQEIEHVREGKHGARSPRQAIAIGLSKARRAGVPLPPPAPGRTRESTRRSAERDYETGQGRRRPRRRAPASRRSKAERLHAARAAAASKGARRRSKAAKHAAATGGRQRG